MGYNATALCRVSNFEQRDQIDFTGPFEILSRMPDATIQTIGKDDQPLHDIQGLRLTPDILSLKRDVMTFSLYPVGLGSKLSCAMRKC